MMKLIRLTIAIIAINFFYQVGLSQTVVKTIPAPVENIVGLAFDRTFLWLGTEYSTPQYESVIFQLSPIDGSVVDSVIMPKRFGSTYNNGVGFYNDHLYGAMDVDTNSHVIYKFDVASKSIIDSIPINFGRKIHGICFKDGLMYVNVFYLNTNDTTFVFDTLGNIISKIPLPFDYVHGLAWDGSNFWISVNPIFGYSIICKLDPNTFHVMAGFLAPGGAHTNGLTWDGAYLWSDNNDSDSLYQIDISEVQPCPPINLIYSITDASPGLNDGAVKINASGGEPPYVYSLDNIEFQNSSTFTALDTGTYEAFITDHYGCSTQGIFTITYDSTVGTQSIDILNSIQVFPNPFSDELFIELNNTSSGNLKLINVLGREILSYRYVNTSNIKLNVTQIPQGVYYLEVINNKGEKLHTTLMQIKAG